MIRSMTGFGAAASDPGDAARGIALRVEIRSVNHRFLQVKVRLPAELAPLEHAVEERVRKRLKRGSIAIHVAFAEPGALKAASVNRELALSYRDLLAGLSRELDLAGEVEIGHLVALPGVIGGEVDDRQLQLGGRSLMRSIDQALEALREMRAAEGEALERDLRRNAAAVDKVGARIERRMPGVVRRHHATLRKRVGELLGSGEPVPPADVAREVALLADRMDVSEELSRLASHLEQLGKLLDRGGDLGRKLDFLVQELFREANTVGSKCNDARVAHDVVELKTLIERLREQVQNVE